MQNLRATECVYLSPSVVQVHLNAAQDIGISLQSFISRVIQTIRSVPSVLSTRNIRVVLCDIKKRASI